MIPLDCLISRCIAALVVLIACSSFALSYVNLRLVAISAGIPESLAFLWPLLLDAFLVVGSLVILMSNLEGSDTRTGWLVLITFTGVSTIFNIIESSGNIAMAAHAVPPVALCISLELLMKTLKPCTSPAQPACTEDPVLAHIRAHPGATDDEIAQSLGLHRTTVGRRRKRLIESGKLRMDNYN